MCAPVKYTFNAPWRAKYLQGISRCAVAFAFVLGACSEPPATDPLTVPDPYADFYSIVTVPAWPIVAIEGEWRSIGGQYTISAGTLTDNGKAHAIECRAEGAEFWFTTGERRHSFRGTRTAERITGRIVTKAANGQPGPIQPITFERVQQ